MCAHQNWFYSDLKMEQIKAILKVGDTIKCHDKDDLIKTMTELAKCGIETDFLYEKDGQNGLWLVVTKTA